MSLNSLVRCSGRGGNTLAIVHFFLTKQFPPKWGGRGGGGGDFLGSAGRGGGDFLGTEIHNCQETRRCAIFRHLTVMNKINGGGVLFGTANNNSQIVDRGAAIESTSTVKQIGKEGTTISRQMRIPYTRISTPSPFPLAGERLLR